MNEKDFYKFLKEINPANLPRPYDMVAEIIGIEALCKISAEFGGTAIYIPTLRGIFKEHMNKEILREFDGYNYFELSRKYGLCERTIRSIVSKNKQAMKK